MTSIPLVAFDLDGTLIDSKIDISNAVNHALGKAGVATLPPEQIHDYVGRGLAHLIADCLNESAGLDHARVMKDFWDYYDQHLLDHTQVYSGVQEVLARLHRAKIPMAVVTNKPFHFSKKAIAGLGLSPYFQWIVGGDSLPVQKPSPQMLEPILQDFSHRSVRGLFVGDSQIDIDCGRSVGFVTCGVSYGFRPQEELEEAKADHVIHHFSELLKLPFFAELLF